jgi:hypothetical protein
MFLIETDLFIHPLRWFSKIRCKRTHSRVTSTFAFTLIDAAHRGAILSKVQNYGQIRWLRAFLDMQAKVLSQNAFQDV